MTLLAITASIIITNIKAIQESAGQTNTPKPTIPFAWAAVGANRQLATT